MQGDIAPTSDILNAALPYLQHGALGAGFLLLILCGFIIFRNKPAADAGLASFRQTFLYAGISLAIVGVGANLFQLVEKQKAQDGEHALTVTFKPDITYRNLPDPKLTLLPNESFSENQAIVITKDAVLSIGLDAILDYSKKIETEKAQLAEAVTNLNKAYAASELVANNRNAELGTLSADINQALEAKNTSSILRNSERLLATTNSIRRQPNSN